MTTQLLDSIRWQQAYSSFWSTCQCFIYCTRLLLQGKHIRGQTPRRVKTIASATRFSFQQYKKETEHALPLITNSSAETRQKKRKKERKRESLLDAADMQAGLPGIRFSVGKHVAGPASTPTSTPLICSGIKANAGEDCIITNHMGSFSRSTWSAPA